MLQSVQSQSPAVVDRDDAGSVIGTTVSRDSSGNERRSGLHVAIIMDGNGRWATARGLPRIAGHRAGAKQVRAVVEAAPPLGIGVLTLFAFSSDNWQRPGDEVKGLMRLFEKYLASERPRCIANGVRLSVMGRRDRLPSAVLSAIRATEEATAAGAAMHLRLAVDYSARDTILHAAQRAGSMAEATRESFAVLLAATAHCGQPAGDVDLLIRTGGEQRLSDFLLWECAYAELWFTDRMWPEFDAPQLAAAVGDFRGRDRRFGRVREDRLHATA